MLKRFRDLKLLFSVLTDVNKEVNFLIDLFLILFFSSNPFMFKKLVFELE